MNSSWLTRPLVSFPPLSRKSVWRLRALGLFSLACLVFSPGLVTVGWHVLHGKTIQSRGKTIPVPLAWIAHPTDGLDVSMTRLPVSVFRDPGFMGMITVGRAPFPGSLNKKQIYASWEAAYWNLAVANAVVSGPTFSGSDGQEIMCMQSAYPAQPSRVSASCLFLQGTWIGDFWGDKQDLDTFVGIIRKIR
jgi:hypothetical protein